MTRLKFLILETKSPAWVETARQEYVAKISPFNTLTLQVLKSPSADRDNADSKRQREGEMILKALDKSDLLILFDEAGKSFSNSEEFAKQMAKILNMSKPHIVFAIGGPYGFSAEVCNRSFGRWSLSGLTMNHWVAQIASLEQIYRSLTILKNIPYHNR